MSVTASPARATADSAAATNDRPAGNRRNSDVCDKNTRRGGGRVTGHDPQHPSTHPTGTGRHSLAAASIHAAAGASRAAPPSLPGVAPLGRRSSTFRRRPQGRLRRRYALAQAPPLPPPPERAERPVRGGRERSGPRRIRAESVCKIRINSVPASHGHALTRCPAPLKRITTCSSPPLRTAPARPRRWPTHRCGLPRGLNWIHREFGEHRRPGQTAAGPALMDQDM